MASQFSLLYDELWMYKSDSDGFFSTIVYRSSDTSYSFTVSCVAVNYKDYRSRGCCRHHVVYMHHKRLVHTINVWNSLSTSYGNICLPCRTSSLLDELSMCQTDSIGFFHPQLVLHAIAIKGYSACAVCYTGTKVLSPCVVLYSF